MIPKHKCIKHSLYCNEDTGVHCWPDQALTQLDQARMELYAARIGIALVNWRQESDVTDTVIAHGLLSNGNGGALEDARYPFGFLVWGRDL